MSSIQSYTLAFSLSIALIGTAAIITKHDLKNVALAEIPSVHTQSYTQALPSPTSAVLGMETVTSLSSEIVWNLVPEFYLQGLNKPGITIPQVEVTIEYVVSGLRYFRSFSGTFISKSGGILAPQQAIGISSLPGIDTSRSIEKVSVYIKTPVSLRKKIGTMTLIPGKENVLRSSARLPVGDFVQTAEDENSITLADITALQAEVELQTTSSADKIAPATSSDSYSKFDVDYNGLMDTKDLKIVLQNYKSLDNKGEKP